MKRIPRPLGLTILSQSIQTKKPDEQVIEKLFSYILHNKLQINGKQLSLRTIATLLHIPETTVYKRWTEYQNKLNNAFIGKAGNGAGALGFFSLEAAMEGYLASQAQLAVLVRSQGGQYKPYISSSVNEAIGQNTAMIRTLLDFYKALKGNAPTNALQINNYNAPEGKDNTALKSISINEAMKLLEDQGIAKIGYDENLYPDVAKSHLSSDIPEVRATHQEMSKSDAMPIMLPSTKAKGTEGKVPSKHLTRRIDEEGINPEDDI